MHDAWPKLVESVFTGLVRHARWMARVPMLPSFADVLAQAAMAVGDPGRHRAMRTVEREVSRWEGVSCGPHRFGGVEFRSGRCEFGHLHGCGLLDLRLGILRSRSCVAAGEAEPHHVLGNSAWVSFWLRRESQIPEALALLRLARGVGCDSASASLEDVPHAAQGPGGEGVAGVSDGLGQTGAAAETPDVLEERGKVLAVQQVEGDGNGRLQALGRMP